MLGAYFAVEPDRGLGLGFWPAALVGGLPVAALGGVVERLICGGWRARSSRRSW